MQNKDKQTKMLYAVGTHEPINVTDEGNSSSQQNSLKRPFKLYISDLQ